MKVKELPSIHSRLRLGLTVIIALIVISSSTTVILFNPAQVLAYSRVIENSNDHSNPPMSEERSSPSVSSPSSSPSNDPAPTPTAPSTISQDGGGDVTIQAPLQIPRTLQSTDLVNSLAFYEVTFITSTTGAIDKIQMDFPAGTGIGAAGIIERVGIGGGTLLKSGSSITYDLTTPVSVPAGTFIRLEMFGIKNPINPSTTFTAMITTSDSGGNLIDGPSQTNVYTIKKVGSSDLADGSVTSTKAAESFMKRVVINDNPAGNALGWNPDGVTTDFIVSEPLASGAFGANAIINVGSNDRCDAGLVAFGSIRVSCDTAPLESTILNYVILNLPPEVV